jgi:predicted dehydrogenase
VSKLKVGIIGCGGIARAKHMPSLTKLKEVAITAFANRDMAKAEQAAADFGAPGAKVYSDYRALLEDADVDVVHVCTGNDTHAEITIAALEAGKHVMCEKPMARSAGEARLMVEAASRSGKKLSISYNNRYRQDTQYLYNLCRNGALGDIYYAKAHALRRRGVPTWGTFLNKELQGGGPLIDLGTHVLDMALWLMDNYEPHSVTGSAFYKLGKRANAFNPYGSWDPDKFTVEDSAFAMIRMKNGAVIYLESSFAIHMLQEGTGKVTLCGTEAGADMWNGLTLNGELPGALYENRLDLNGESVPFYNVAKETPADLEARLWIEAILHDREPVVQPTQALVVQQLLDAIYESAETGQTVYFP